MKKLFYHFNILFFLLAANYSFSQQPQWRFPIAFEDATGAKDTIFFVWDSAATLYGQDSIFGEYPMSMPTDTFQVYVSIWNGDSSKTWAISPSDPFEKDILAKNYTYPIKISWDTSLFNSPSLASPVNCAEMDNEYFFMFGGICNRFNMLLTDTVTAPWFNWGSQEQFPLFISINTFGYCCVNGIGETDNKKNSYYVYPNPTSDNLTVKCDDNKIKEITFYSIEGSKRAIFKSGFLKDKEIHISLDFLNQGIYIIEITNHKNQRYYEKVIKY